VEVHDRYEAGEVMSIANLILFLDSAQGPHNPATLIAYLFLDSAQGPHNPATLGGFLAIISAYIACSERFEGHLGDLKAENERGFRP
jgi:hypothetical protein